MFLRVLDLLTTMFLLYVAWLCIAAMYFAARELLNNAVKKWKMNS
jgi:hypothetical protein